MSGIAVPHEARGLSQQRCRKLGAHFCCELWLFQVVPFHSIRQMHYLLRPIQCICLFCCLAICPKLTFACGVSTRGCLAASRPTRPKASCLSACGSRNMFLPNLRRTARPFNCDSVLRRLSQENSCLSRHASWYKFANLICGFT